MHYLVYGYNFGEPPTTLGIYSSLSSAQLRVETIEKHEEDCPDLERFSRFFIEGWKAEELKEVHEYRCRFNKGGLTYESAKYY